MHRLLPIAAVVCLATATAATAAAVWTRYDSREFGYAVELPGTPRVKQLADPAARNPYTGELVELMVDGEEYAFGATTYRDPVDATAAFAAMTRRFTGEGGDVLDSSTQGTVDGYPSMDITMHAADGYVGHVRSVVRGRSMFLFSIGRKGSAPTSTQRVMGSIRIDKR